MATTLYNHRMSDKLYMTASRRMVEPADGTYGIIQLPRYAFVTDVWLYIETAYVAGTPSITVGFEGNGETANELYFITNDIAEPTVIGTKCSTKDTVASFRSKYFNGGNSAITVTVANGSASTKGVFTVFAQYAVIS